MEEVHCQGYTQAVGAGTSRQYCTTVPRGFMVHMGGNYLDLRDICVTVMSKLFHAS